MKIFQWGNENIIVASSQPGSGNPTTFWFKYPLLPKPPGNYFAKSAPSLIFYLNKVKSNWFESFNSNKYSYPKIRASTIVLFPFSAPPISIIAYSPSLYAFISWELSTSSNFIDFKLDAPVEKKAPQSGPDDPPNPSEKTSESFKIEFFKLF